LERRAKRFVSDFVVKSNVQFNRFVLVVVHRR